MTLHGRHTCRGHTCAGPPVRGTPVGDTPVRGTPVGAHLWRTYHRQYTVVSGGGVMTNPGYVHVSGAVLGLYICLTNDIYILGLCRVIWPIIISRRASPN